MDLLSMTRAQMVVNRAPEDAGLRFHRGMWEAKIGQETIGRYPKKEEALYMRLRRERDLYGILPNRAYLFKRMNIQEVSSQ